MNRADVGAALFDADGVVVSDADLGRGLVAVGVGRGDVLFVHSDLAVFGRLLTTDRAYLMERLCSVLMRAVGGKGTIIMPTFTYSFCKGEVFDPATSRSTVGALTEYFRRRPDVSRTRHPIFSAAVWGRDREWFTEVGLDSFDDASIFGKLRTRDGKIAFLGVPFRLACTYVHHIEQASAVQYRFIKEFPGVIRNDAEETDVTCTYFVRHLDRNVNTDLTRFERWLRERAVLRETRVGAAVVGVVAARALFDEGRRFLAANIHGFLEGEDPHAVSLLQER